MAQDSNSNSAPPAQDVNIDELEVDILILAKNPQNLNQMSSFLTRRGWPTTVTGNLSKAIETIAAERPDFVLISFSHANPAVARLPELIVQTFNLTCIGFVESSDTQSTNRLANTKMRYKVTGTPSGPNLQRTIRRILAEKFNVKLEEKGAKESESSVSEKSSTVTISGGKKRGNHDKVIMQKGAGSDFEYNYGDTSSDAQNPGAVRQGKTARAESSITQRSKEGKAHKAVIEEGIDPDSDALILPLEEGETSGSVWESRATGRNLRRKAGVDEEPVATESTDGVTAGREYDDGDSSHPTTKKARIRSANSGGITEGEEGLDSDEIIDAEETPLETGAENAEISKRSKSGRRRLKNILGEDNVAAPAVPVAEGGGSTEGSAHEVPSEGTPTVDLVGMLKKSLFGEDGLGDSASTSEHGALERAVEKALAAVCVSQSEPMPFETVVRVGVFPIDSESLPGYIVLAFAQGLGDDEIAFLKACERSLQTSIQEHNVSGKIEKGFWLNLPPVLFDPWVENVGAFHFKVAYQGIQVGVVFLQADKRLPKAKVVNENGMYTFAIEDISTAQPVNFKAYLHLEKNEKYYLYLRNGRHLQPEQKLRLQQRQITEIFMKSIDIENLRLFLANAFLLDSIKNSSEAA